MSISWFCWNSLSSVIRSIGGKAKASLIKLDRPYILDKYSTDELSKLKELEAMAAAGALSEIDLNMRRRVIDNRKRIIDTLNTDERVFRSFYYFVIYDSDKTAAKEVQSFAVRSMAEGGIVSKPLNDKELAVFLKYNYTVDFDEREIDLLTKEEYMNWISPANAQFTLQKAIIEGVGSYNFTIRDFPLSVLNAWGYQLFNIKDTKVVMNISPVAKEVAVRRIDRAIDEIMSQGLDKGRTR